MAAFKCGNCSENSHFTPTGTGETTEVKVNNYDRVLCQQALRCDMCRRLTVAYQIERRVPYGSELPGGWVAFWNNVNKPHAYYPRPTIVREYPNTPAHIAEAATEAYKVHGIDAFRATSILCRAVIEAVCKDKEATGRDLFTKIDNLYERGIIRLFVKETAHVIRAIGNDMAHGDFDQEVNSEDAQHILGFMDSILDEIYESTAKLDKMQNIIAERKALAKGTP